MALCLFVGSICLTSFCFCVIAALKSEKIHLVACGRNHTLISTGHSHVRAFYCMVYRTVSSLCVCVCGLPCQLRDRYSPQGATARGSLALGTARRGQPSTGSPPWTPKVQSKCLLLGPTPLPLSQVRHSHIDTNQESPQVTPKASVSCLRICAHHGP